MGERLMCAGSKSVWCQAWLAASAALLTASLGSDAVACGGTFCDQGPSQQVETVDQAGENVVFVYGEAVIEAHVQIRYEGDPNEMAWIIPMPSEPEVEVGSQALFDALLSSTAPSFGVRTTFVCDGQSDTSSSGCGTAMDADSAGSAGPTEDSAAVNEPIGQTVGAFEVSFLSGESTASVMTWLQENNFSTPENTSELIEQYVNQGSVLVAIRMRPDAGLDEIHPLVLRYEGDTPLIPIRLTAVAATEDMRVRTFFLGERRVVPKNYKHVELNLARLDWFNPRTSYPTLVAEAVDDEAAEGRGFVSEYAGSTEIVKGDPNYAQIFDERWDAEAFLDIAGEDILDEMERQGLLTCGPSNCVAQSDLVANLLAPYANDGQGPLVICNNCATPQLDFSEWDPETFAAQFEERIIEPGRHAKQLLDDHPYLTRLYSHISPDEMTVDPAFHQARGMADVGTERWLEQSVNCNGSSSTTLPNGFRVKTANALLTDDTDDMPAAESVQTIDAEGEVEVVADHSEEIEATLQSLNQPEREPQSANDDDAGSRARGVGCVLNAGPHTQYAPLWLLGLSLLFRRVGRRRRAR